MIATILFMVVPHVAIDDKRYYLLDHSAADGMTYYSPCGIVSDQAWERMRGHRESPSRIVL